MIVELIAQKNKGFYMRIERKENRLLKAITSLQKRLFIF